MLVLVLARIANCLELLAAAPPPGLMHGFGEVEDVRPERVQRQALPRDLPSQDESPTGRFQAGSFFNTSCPGGAAAMARRGSS